MEPGGDVAWQQMASEGAAGLLRDGRRVSEADEQAAAEEAKKVAAVEGQGKQAPALLLEGLKLGIGAAAHWETPWAARRMAARMRG